MKKSSFAIIGSALLIILASAAVAEIPGLISYQGVLTDDTGTVVPDGTYQLTFRIYDVATGGTDLWNEIQDVQVTGGLFTVMLGSVSPLNLDFDTGYYLGITVESESELSPRVRLCSSPYAISAGSLAGSANWIPSGGDVGLGTTEPQHKLHIVDTGYDDVVLDIQSSAGSGELKVQTDSHLYNYFSLSKHGSSASGTVAGVPLANLSRLVAGSSAGPVMIQVASDNPLYFVTGDTERMRITGDGSVGIGASTPSEMLEVTGAVKIGNSSGTGAGTIRWTGSDFEGYDGSSWNSLTASGGGTSLPAGINGSTLRHDGTDWTSVTNLFNNGTRVGIGTTTPAEALDVSGNIHASGQLQATSAVLGTASQPGSLTVDRFGSTMMRATSSGDGAKISMYDEAGEYTFRLEPDTDGEGGYMGIYSEAGGGVPEFLVDANYSATGDPMLRLNGSSRSITLNTSVSGDDAVNLPVNSINSVEISDEPGVTTSTDATTTVDLVSSTWTVIDAVTIPAPADGYVIVIGSCHAECSHTNGTTSIGRFGVSDSPTNAPANQDLNWSLSYAEDTGIYKIPVTVHCVFTAVEGSNTYYLMGYEFEGDYSAANGQLTAIYVPTSYGGLSSVATSRNGEEDSRVITGRSQSYLAAEHRDALSAERERVESELTEMREKFRRLKEKVERLYRQQER